MFGSIFNQKKTKDDQTDQQPAAGAAVSQSGATATPPVSGVPADPSAQTPEATATPTDQSAPADPNQTPGQPQDPNQPVPAEGQVDPTTGQPIDPATGEPADPDTQAPGATATTGTPAAAGAPGQVAAGTHADVSALSHLDPRSSQVLTHAQEEAKRIKQQNIEPDQLLIGLLYDEQIFRLLGEFQTDGGKVSKELQAKEKMGTFKGQPVLSKTAQEIFDQAYRDAKMRGSNFISPEDLFIVLCSPTYTTGKYLQTQGLKKEAIVEKLAKNPQANYAHKTVLEKYGIDLTEEARSGKLDPVAGRDKEVDRIVHILLRRTKNNPIIIGETGVGKTAIVEGLAQMIVAGKIPHDLQDKRIFQLDVASLVAGASHRGEFEERMRAVINEVLGSNNKIILFIDEIHSLMGTGEGEGVSAANIIKPHLARGHFQLIGATTTTEYRKNFEKDKAFERRFQPVLADEPSEENAFEMLKVLRPKYEKFHHVTIPDEALKECVKLAKKYIGERYLPDKGVDLLDEASSEVKLQMDAGKRGENQVKKADIEKVVSAWTGIPITKLTEDESEKLLKLEDRIHQRLVDQEQAVIAVSEAVRRGRIGLASGQRPIASFIFLGPTGVGKTELAKTLAELLFGRDDAMARLDMSEYMEKHEVAKLIGAPPGYVGYEEGGVLTEAVRKKPYSIVLMDEIEKAHPDVFNILLQLLEDGRLTDNKGNTISFKNTIVICTSNIGSSLIQQQLSAIDKDAHPTTEQIDKQVADLQKLVKDELTKFLRPEVLNRFDEVVIFKPLRPEHMAGIVRLEIAKTAKLLKEQGYSLQITEKAVAKLAKDGYDPVYGARPLRRLIQTAIENPIALAIIARKFVPGDTIVIDYSDNTNEFIFEKTNAKQAKAVLSDADFKVILQKLAHPETITDESERNSFTALHDKLVQASSSGNKTASSILSINATSSDLEVQAIRKELDAAQAKGDALATEILELADKAATQIQASNNLKKVLLQIINPLLTNDAEKKDRFVELHDLLTQEQAKNNPLAVAIMTVNQTTPPQAIDKIMVDLNVAKEQGDEFATAILSAVNEEVVAEAEEAHQSDPVTKYRKVFKSLINPLYLAEPESKEKFTKLYDKISEASKQNHTLATEILAINDITSDADIQQLKEQLEEAKKNGDPLAIEILEAIETEIKYEGIASLQKTLALIINPMSASVPVERDQYTQLQRTIAAERDKGNQLATAILSVTDATTKDDVLALKQQLEKAAEQGDAIAKVVLDSVAQGQAATVEAPAQTGQPADPNAPTAGTPAQPEVPGVPQGPLPQQPIAPQGVAQTLPQQVVGVAPVPGAVMPQQPMGMPTAPVAQPGILPVASQPMQPEPIIQTPPQAQQPVAPVPPTVIASNGAALQPNGQG